MTRGEPIDWAAARARIAAIEASVSEAISPSPQRSKQLLDERSRLLARPPQALGREGHHTEYLVFSLQGQRLAIETRYVREVMRMPELTRVPGASSLLAGVTSLRGDLLAVFDLRRFFGIGADGGGSFARAIVCGAERAEFAILADEGVEVSGIAEDETLDIPFGSERAGCVRGVTREAISLLDAHALLSDAKLFLGRRENGSRTAGFGGA